MTNAQSSSGRRGTTCVLAIAVWCFLAVWPGRAESLTITTLAGPAESAGAIDGTGSAARFNDPFGVAVDGSGNVYVADYLNNAIRKVTPAGVVSTLAGLAGTQGSADGTGSAARFDHPYGVAVDASGNVYVADNWNNTIRKITPAGVVRTLAGLGGAQGSVDGTGSAARFNSPSGVAVDGSGNVYVADRENNTIRKITAAGLVSTLAGLAGSPGSADGTGSDARFCYPWGVTVDGSGNVYVGEYGNSIVRKITPAGVVSTLAGSAGIYAWADGTGSAALFDCPLGVAVDGSGNVYAADSNNNVIRKITPAGVVSTLAGSFNHPCGVAVDGSGNVYVADSDNTIRKITPAGVVSTLAGLGGGSGSADGAGSAAHFYFPCGVAVDGSGNVYVADSGNDTIRKITPAGVVSTLAGLARKAGSADGTGGAARFNVPSGVAVDGSGNVYVADTSNHTIRKITPEGVVSTLAGLAGSPGSADGAGSAARFRYPSGVAVDDFYLTPANDDVQETPVGDPADAETVVISPGPDGILQTQPTAPDLLVSALLVTDWLNFPGVQGDDVEVLVGGNLDCYILAGPNGVLDTPVDSTVRQVQVIVGGGGYGANGVLVTGGTATTTITVYRTGNVYVADTSNHTVRKITPSGVVSTLAGLAGSSGSVDSTGSAARFYQPFGVAVDGSGNVYVADRNNYTIRKITPEGVVSTLAGTAGSAGNADGTGSGARFNVPSGVAVDGSGNVYVADSGNDTIRGITPENVVSTLAGLAGAWGSADGIGNAARFDHPEGVAVDASGNVYVADRYNNSIRKGGPAIADVATIDQASGVAGATRHLDTNPQTATAWQWSEIRVPTGSSAALSATTVRNPTFTPDVADLYVFRLVAADASGGQSISTVLLTVTAGPGQPGNEMQVVVWLTIPASVSIAWGEGTTGKTAGDVTPLNWRVKGAGGDQLGLSEACVSNDEKNNMAMKIENMSNTGTNARVSAAVTGNGAWNMGSAPATDTFVMQAKLGDNAPATLTVAAQELTGTTTLARGADQALVLTVMTPTDITRDAGVAKPILVTLTATPE